MRISISGTAHSGKSSLVKSFLYTWKNYKSPEKTYRDLLKEEGLDHSSKTTTDTQERILDFMVDQLQSNDNTSKVIYDRCPLDNIAYSMWCHDKNKDGFTREFISKQITLARESMRHLDIIFICRYNEHVGKTTEKENELREKDPSYIKEVDNILYSLHQQWMQNPESNVFFPKEDTPCLIVLPDDQQQRIDLIAEYVNPQGELFSDEESILNPDNLNELEQLVKSQQASLDQEEKEKELLKKFGI
jgi:predicted ATPase